MNLTNINDIKSLLGRHGFHFSKSMGQNFLIESWVPHDIAEAAGLDESCGVLEIGPGIGPLTQQLALRAGKVAAIELDRDLLPILGETMGEYDNVEIIPGDAMKIDLGALVSEKFGSLTPKACANLPYNITTPVITKLLEAGCFRTITVMIQREVARRICAAPGDPDCGAFSLFCQYHAECELLFEVPPSASFPPPRSPPPSSGSRPVPHLPWTWTKRPCLLSSRRPTPSGGKPCSTASLPPTAAGSPRTSCVRPSWTAVFPKPFAANG